ncbi:IS1249 family transposase [Leifsonia sp. CL147]|uniref:IS1249 family transposase n=1 Tax=Leifsonia sp. CL147 TaxID=1798215 RepID=UPI0008EB3FDF|nr:IS1249 family transposase [Leifsonia sp. CL147]SFM06528.1 MULE transposase domain-containing protein [Leifsonia sp. CL147]
MVCGTQLVKNGRHPSGTQRWRCRNCGASSVRRRADVSQREQLRRFLTWLTGKASQSELTGDSGRTFRRATAWCWQLEPRMPVTGEVHDAVLVDGVWIGSWCLLIAQSSSGTVIAWQWAARETTAAWEALFAQIPPPAVVVTDGGSGIRSALANTWPDTLIQRCIFHLQLNVTRELTRNPRLRAGRALRQIALNLTTIHDIDAAIAWRLTLEAWWQRFGHLTRERTLYDNGQFGYTHLKLRRAWGILHRAAEAGHIFTNLEHGNPRATSRLEGLNSQIRHLLRHHRGMPIHHRRRAVEWFLLLHEITIDHAHKHAHIPQQAPPTSANDEPIGPALYDTGLNPEEGLWTRSGWAGHS